MLKKIASLVPFALIVAATACVGETSGEDEQGAPQEDRADEALTSAGDGVTDEPVASSESELRAGGARIGGIRVGGARAGGVRVGGVRAGGVAVGGARWGGARWGGRRWGAIGGVRRGWVNGVWAPGWGWNSGVWVVGGGVQYACTTDLDCASQLGPRVAVCDFEPTVGLGQCVAPGWF
jgi:hypothetical protein